MDVEQQPSCGRIIQKILSSNVASQIPVVPAESGLSFPLLYRRPEELQTRGQQTACFPSAFMLGMQVTSLDWSQLLYFLHSGLPSQKPYCVCHCRKNCMSFRSFLKVGFFLNVIITLQVLKRELDLIAFHGDLLASGDFHLPHFYSVC